MFRCGDGYKTKTKVVSREQINESSLKRKYSERYWLYQYSTLKYLESSQQHGQEWLKKFQQQLGGVYIASGLPDSLKFIKQQFEKSD